MHAGGHFWSTIRRRCIAWITKTAVNAWKSLRVQVNYILDASIKTHYFHLVISLFRHY